MKSLWRDLALLGSVLCLLPLTACGGDGSSSSPPPVSVEPPTPPVVVNEAPVFSSAPTAVMSENTTNAFYTIQVNDPDSNASPSVSLSSSGDGQYFEIDTLTNSISARAGLDYELPADANGDNIYNLTLIASDANGGNTSFALTVTVTDGRLEARHAL